MPFDPTRLRYHKEGDLVSADEWNLVMDLLKREVHGDHVISDNLGWYILTPPGGGGGGVAIAGFAMVTSRFGTDLPYRYTCSSAVMNINGDWTEAVAPTVFNNCFNVEEQGHGGHFVAPLTVEDVVLVYDAPAAVPIDAHVIHRAHYRGTF